MSTHRTPAGTGIIGQYRLRVDIHRLAGCAPSVFILADAAQSLRALVIRHALHVQPDRCGTSRLDESPPESRSDSGPSGERATLPLRCLTSGIAPLSPPLRPPPALRSPDSHAFHMVQPVVLSSASMTVRRSQSLKQWTISRSLPSRIERLPPSGRGSPLWQTPRTRYQPPLNLGRPSVRRSAMSRAVGPV